MLGQVSRRKFFNVGLALLGPMAVAACGGQPPASPTSAAKPPQPASTSAVSTAVQAAAPTNTVGPAAQGAQVAPASSSTLPKVNIWQNIISLTNPQGSDPQKLAAMRQYIQTNAKVDPMATIPPTGTAAQEKLNLMLSDQSQQIDTFSGNWDQYKDAVIPINDLLDKYGQAVRQLAGDNLWYMVTDTDGKIWGLPRLDPELNVHPIWFRTDWLQKAGLKMPSTLAELETAFTEFRKIDPNATILTNGLVDFRYATVGGFTMFGYSNWLDPSDSLLKPPELQPDYKDWVAKMADWYKKGWIYKDSFANHDDTEAFRGGHIGIFAGWYSRVTIWFQKVKSAVPGMDFDFNKAGITGPKGLMETYQPGGTAAIMITKKAKDPAAIMQFMNWQCAKNDNWVSSYYGLPDVDWKWTDSQHYFIDRLNTNSNKVYAGDFVTVSGPLTEPHSAPNDPLLKSHYLFIRDRGQWKDAKQLVDFGVPYDQSVIKKQVPGLADLQRLTDEETTKFITGVRPLSDWNNFLGQLKSAGLDAWEKAYTTQYQQFKSPKTPRPQA